MDNSLIDLGFWPPPIPFGIAGRTPGRSGGHGGLHRPRGPAGEEDGLRPLAALKWTLDFQAARRRLNAGAYALATEGVFRAASLQAAGARDPRVWIIWPGWLPDGGGGGSQPPQLPRRTPASRRRAA